jgi:hypothetical protein
MRSGRFTILIALAGLLAAAGASGSLVLDRTVRKILGDPGLENVLAEFMATARGGAGGAA